jgi:NAD(P)-dependent dehydrogenase (short-subunit alcohol dehydrogenase family)
MAISSRAAIVTGGSRGIGFAIAEALAQEGYGLTLTARKPETLAEAAERLTAQGAEVETVAADVADEAAVREVVSRHQERFGRLDVLVNNAGIGIGANASQHQTKHIDLQLAVNLRAIILFYRECAELLQTAGREHGNALVVNLASIAGKASPSWLSVYGAVKAGVISYSESMNKELNGDGVKSVAFCPGFVDTDMTAYLEGTIDRADMLQTTDIVEALRFLLRVSPACVVPEIVFRRPGETI